MAKYKPLKRYLKNCIKNDELFLNKDQIQEIIELAILQDGYESNVSYDIKRTEFNPREKAFSDEWLKENMPRPGVNHGQGILQDLFIEHANQGLTRKWNKHITIRDRMIAATVIQWIGTNCGMAFLNNALKRFGCSIDYTKMDAKI